MSWQGLLKSALRPHFGLEVPADAGSQILKNLAGCHAAGLVAAVIKEPGGKGAGR